jgi:hypothetical protein
MISLDQDISLKKNNLEDFKDVTIRILNYIPNVLTGEKIKGIYKLHYSNQAGQVKWLRPINQILFIYDPHIFLEDFNKFIRLFTKLKQKNGEYTEADLFLIDSVLYTIQQAIGCCFDLMVNANSGRKHVGNRFEELMRAVFNEMGIANVHHVLKIPFETEDGIKIYSCEMDLIISPFESVRSTRSTIDENEIVVSAKTTSKDRMGKMFMDKILLEKNLKHKQKVIGIFLNDVQRSKENNISHTLVANLFLAYTRLITPLEGVYYLDPPPNAHKEPFNKYMAPFSVLLSKDIWKLLST